MSWITLPVPKHPAPKTRAQLSFVRVPVEELTCDEQSSVPAGLRPSGLKAHEAHLQLLLLGLRSGEHPAVPGLLHHGGHAHRAAELQPARSRSLEAGRRLREHRCWKMEGCREKPQDGYVADWLISRSSSSASSLCASGDGMTQETDNH